ncbi:hypothetical protein ACIBTV_25470 [Micromonospora sp. NPDC049366]|uniref:hypothetical protein n=1 Tax=Micromonospora sp. NPDC049366 TaxID=3364271 RepID=UPI003787DEAF
MMLDVYGARREAVVMEATWGHLRPNAGRHEGFLLAAASAYGGERTLIDGGFQGVPDSRWLHEAMLDEVDDAEMELAGLYRFIGVCVVVGERVTLDGDWERLPLDVHPLAVVGPQPSGAEGRE